MTRLRLITLVGLILAIAAGLLAVEIPIARGGHGVTAVGPDHSRAPGVANIAVQAAPPRPTLKAGPVTVPAGLYEFGWALLDRHSNQLSGSANKDTMTNTTESMVKAWLAADYLRRLGASKPIQQTLDEITLMIENSDDVLADKYYDLDGGPESINRLISTCGLQHTAAVKSGWSYTEITPADAARYGKCIGDTTAAGPMWTDWLLDKMRHVIGGVNDQLSARQQGGHWGIIDGLPNVLVPDTAIKNGWTFIYNDKRWHINCMAVHPDWVLTVEMQFYGSQTSTGLQQGANACASVARQLVYAPDL